MKINYFKKTKRTPNSFILLSIVVCFSMITHAQKIQLNGIVENENEQPMIGVNVLVKGTNQGTVTDFDGNYTIETDQGVTLIFSYLNYLNKEIIVESNSILTFNYSLTNRLLKKSLS